jgi:hypothetical protein
VRNRLASLSVAFPFGLGLKSALIAGMSRAEAGRAPAATVR